jgi:hypothetical protein
MLLSASHCFPSFRALPRAFVPTLAVPPSFVANIGGLLDHMEMARPPSPQHPLLRFSDGHLEPSPKAVKRWPFEFPNGPGWSTSPSGASKATGSSMTSTDPASQPSESSPLVNVTVSSSCSNAPESAGLTASLPWSSMA